MLAIYKKELKSYFHSMIGYVFMAFMLVIVGVYFYAYNLHYQVANFEYVLNSVTFIFIILVPILTMRIMAEEKKQKTDQLLFTSAVSVPKIILAKYFAVMTLYAVCMAVICLYPVILLQFGDVPMGTSYASIFGFFLLGAAYIAIGLLISSVTESQVIAGVVGFITFLLSYIISGLSDVLPTDKLSTMLIVIFLAAVACYVIYLSIRKLLVAVGAFVLSTAAFVLLYFFKSSFYDNLLTKIINCFALTTRFDNFTYGIINLGNVFYYITIVFLFLMLTALFVKESLSDKMKAGSVYRTSLVIVATVLVVVANLFINTLDLSVDVSSNRMYSITDETKDFAKGLKDKITIYYVCEEGKEDPSVQKIVKKYNNLSSKIKVVTKDPVLYPAFTKKYTDEDVTSNSIIVVNNDTKASKYVAYNTMFEGSYDQSYQYQVTGIDVEGQITSALDYVTNTELPTLYTTSGHGETELGTTVTTAIEKQNVSIKDLATLTVSEVPEDCNVLLINGPTSDFSDDELTMIKLYLKNGGNAIITCAYTENKMDNFESLLKYYGVYPAKGIVVESQGNYVSNYVTNCLPSYGSHEIVNGISSDGKYVVMPTSIGLTASDNTRGTLTMTDLLKTSQDAYSKVDTQSDTVEKEKGDVTGPFDLGVLAEEKESDSSDDVKTKVAVYGSVNLLNENIVQTGQFANTDLLTNTISYMVETASNVTIPVKSMDTVYLTVSAAQSGIWGAGLVIVLPLAILIVGFVIWIRRRRC